MSSLRKKLGEKNTKASGVATLENRCKTSLPAAKLTELAMHLRTLLRPPIKNDGPHEIGAGTRAQTSLLHASTGHADAHARHQVIS